MAVFPPDIQDLMPWNNLQEFINDFTKGVQEIADLLDPTVDNSGLPVVLGTKFSTPIFWRVCVNNVTDAYSDWMHSYGGQPYLLAGQLNVSGSMANVSQFTVVGKLKDGAWNNLNASDKEYVDGLINSFPFGSKYSIVNINNAPIVSNVSSGADPTYVDVPLLPYGYSHDTLYYHNLDHNDTAFNVNLGVLIHDLSTYEETEDPAQIGYISIVGGNSNTIPNIANKPLTPHQLPFMGTTEDQNFIDKYVAGNGAEHNYHVTTSDGYDVYYGDNYYIIKVNNEPVTYNKIYNTMTTTVPDIDPEIHVPTYTENKYGPEPPPEPDIDDDIEVEMDLNDAAFGEGLSHYYVTTVDAPVLSDISAAMSSWNINNTGKDLYRNLLSCRITKVGPIPAENSTFVIYGEELQYNGSPISINKITGNPSMDLGEYEILPKFNDFRDYAPYTKIEMFIPYCGWVALPSHVMSSEEKPKIITGTLLCDIIAGTCKAVIKCNDTVVAEASGFTAVDVPFTGENVGMKMAGIASAITSYGNTASKTVGNIASGGLSGGAGAGASTAGGLVGLLGSYAQLHSAFNANYTEICGKTGDGCNVAGLNKVYIKIQRPKTGGYEAPDFVPEDYGHTTGFIAMKKSQISECEGLIVCANPDTSGIGGATDRERQMIKNLLESGIIVRQTEPEP